MTTIIDRRSSGTRSTANQERLQRRVRARLKHAVDRMAGSESIEDLARGDSPISIPVRDLHEPSFRRDPEGTPWERVLPGNKEYQRGDLIQKPEGGAARQGREGSPDGMGDDGVAIVLSPDEFLDLLFDGLALPNLRKTAQGDVQSAQWRRSGFIRDGSPSLMHVGRTMRAARARRLALRAGKHRELEKLQETRNTLHDEIHERRRCGQDVSLEQERLQDLDQQIAALERKIRAIPFIDETDLRFSHIDQQPHPITNAVMMCVMDVSGSMGETEKDLGKRFFLLLYLFLQRHYQAVTIVFVKHHSTAMECGEQEFFGAREGGGTLVSPAILLMEDIVSRRFPSDRWNVYVAEVSDGDNYSADNAIVDERLREFMPRLRNLFYLEVNRESESDLFQLYESISQSFPGLVTARANAREDIYPLFRALFAAEEIPNHA